jgi:hypothetical protein
MVGNRDKYLGHESCAGYSGASAAHMQHNLGTACFCEPYPAVEPAAKVSVVPERFKETNS